MEAWTLDDEFNFLSDYNDSLLFEKGEEEKQELWENYDEYSSAIYEQF